MQRLSKGEFSITGTKQHNLVEYTQVSGNRRVPKVTFRNVI
ncbi:hypothetical protein CF5_0095 [Staphylococcus phage CF5]|uniref:Uncharacterized protein n=1 Tax=Staphylococcus phage CF5 TaxID=3113739 RepID=A0AAX4J7R6_9CAUD|nr:hypothetical protein CF5_0095 [Staphylococcus phage CF5]